MSVKQNRPTSLFLTDNAKMDGIPTKNKPKTQTLFALYFKFRRYFLQKFVRYNHQIFYFFLFYISFYISRYPFQKDIFLKFYRTSFNITWKKYFCHEFPFQQIHSNLPPFNSQNLLSMTKVFYRCSQQTL